VKLALLVIVLAACSSVKQVGGEVGGHLAEWIACPTDLVDCGHVFMCAAPADNELGHVEICIDDDDHPEQVQDVEAVYGECILTPRHEGLCIMKCPPNTGAGCNAFSGCWCPG
jgi:hypothetical protein